MKVLVLQSYGGAGEFIIEDSIDGFRRLGNTVEKVDLNEDFPINLLNKIKEFYPDFVFTIDHNGFLRPIIDELNKKEILHVSWFTGYPLHWAPK
ncbi:TPA: hypothetical protein DCX15_00820, partial [bacterium]|nr:hypothetical protein [bacterium]